MDYKNLEEFLDKNLHWVLPKKGELSQKNFLSAEHNYRIKSRNWVSYCGGHQAYLKQELNRLCESVWGSGFSVQVLFTIGSIGMSDKLSIWVVPVHKTTNKHFY